ncbi:MAG: FAD-binding oxidoreductase [Myxococcales bacterium]|nr:FAD-binding oxidoreductase [Myxococcales bacterium]
MTGSCPTDQEYLVSYGRLDDCCVELWEPKTTAELAECLIEAGRRGVRVAFRASGLSLHDQSLGHDGEVVISMAAFDHIEPVDVEAQQVTVGAAATWGAVVDATIVHDLVPYVVPTSESITCGGSLATDGISRYSPSYGSESRHVAAFELLTVGAREPRWIERPDPDDHESEDAVLFRAVIGGFGYLGVITRIRYDLLSVAEVGAPEMHNQKVRVTTELWVQGSFRELIQKQIDLLVEPIEEDLEKWEMPKKADPIDYPSVYTVAFPHDGDGRGAVYRSVYSRGDVGDPYIIYRPHWWVRKWMGLALSQHWLRKVVSASVWTSMRFDEGKPFVNDLKDYMFFMDGEVEAKRWMESGGRLVPLIQQTFVVHYLKAEAFLREIPPIVKGIEPTLFEFLFMPRDHILMSASYDTPGFAITLAFQDVQSEARQKQVIAAMKELTHVLASPPYEGRLHFTKNVYADDEDLRTMFRDQAARFLELKRRYDPQGVLHNPFFERIFP